MKNIHVFKTELPSISEFEAALIENEKLMFTRCGDHDFSRFGFSPKATLTMLSNGYKIAYTFQEKKIPSATVKELVDEKVADFEKTEERPILRRERNEFKEQVLKHLCTKALTTTTTFEAFYHTEHKLLVVDIASEALASSALKLICHCLQSVKTETLHVSAISNSLAINLAKSIRQNVDLGFAGFTLGDKLHLENVDGEQVKYKGDYSLEHIEDLIADDYVVKLITLKKDNITFDFTSELRIKSIRVDPELFDEIDADDVDDERLIREATTLELMVNICLDLVNYFDKAAETNKRK